MKRSAHGALLGLLASLAACHSGGSSPRGPAGTPSPTPTPSESVLEHHHTGNRRGVYLQPSLTQALAATLVLDTTFAPVLSGNVYAQPLYLADPAGHDKVFAATESNQVSAWWASNGRLAWQTTLAPPIALSALPCGNIDPLGVTGTPVIDAARGILFAGAMTDAGGGTPRQKIYALDLASGNVLPGWPVDLESTVSAVGVGFTSLTQNQRPALTLLGGRVYAGYGGHAGDCGTYYGWLVSVDEVNPGDVLAWRTPVTGSAIWGVSGAATDGLYLYAATGNALTASSTWQGSETIFRFDPGPVFTGNTADYYAPSDFQSLDASDKDLAGTEPILVDLAGPPRAQLVIGLGKDGYVYLLDRSNLGGVGGELSTLSVTSSEIINAAASYTTASGTYVVFKVTGGFACTAPSDVVAVKLVPGTPPTATVAWCANQNGGGSPMVTQTQADGGQTIVWGLGTESDAEGAGDLRLHGFDGDTGAVVYGGGGAAEQLGNLRRFTTPIAAKGRIFVAGDGRLYAFRAP